MENTNNKQDLGSLWWDFTVNEIDFDIAIQEAESRNYTPDEYDTLEILTDNKKKFNDSFFTLYDADYYFEYCSYLSYINNYSDNLKSFIDKYKDADEINFLNNECIRISLITGDESYNINRYKFTTDNYHRLEFSCNRIVKYLRTKIESLTAYPVVSESIESNQTRFKSNITATELVELVKALIITNSVKGTSKEIFEDFSTFFGVELKTPHKTFQHIKDREVGNETLFLDKLKSTLLDLISK